VKKVKGAVVPGQGPKSGVYKKGVTDVGKRTKGRKIVGEKTVKREKAMVREREREKMKPTMEERKGGGRRHNIWPVCASGR